MMRRFGFKIGSALKIDVRLTGARLLLPILALAFFLSGCGPSSRWHRSTLMFFDTVCELRMYGTGAGFHSAEDQVRRIFTDIEARFAPETRVDGSPMILDLYEKALSVHRASRGAFDITVDPLSRLWGFRTGEHRIPSDASIQALLPLIGMTRLTRDGDRLEIPAGMRLDWGGIAKGYGIDLASRALIEAGVSRGFINAGGDLSCWGRNPDGKPWQVGVQHPRSAGFLGVLSLEDQGVATTGDYQRYFLLEETRWHHVFDPRTGYPARGKQSVTVVGPETAMCDALSTALFVSGQPESVIKAFPDYGAVQVDDAGRISFLGKPLAFRPYSSER